MDPVPLEVKVPCTERIQIITNGISAVEVAFFSGIVKTYYFEFPQEGVSVVTFCVKKCYWISQLVFRTCSAVVAKLSANFLLLYLSTYEYQMMCPLAFQNVFPFLLCDHTGLVCFFFFSCLNANYLHMLEHLYQSFSGSWFVFRF